MKYTVKELTSRINEYLFDIGFNKNEVIGITKNILEAELAGKSSHGVIRLKNLKGFVESGDTKLLNNVGDIEITKTTDSSYLIDAKYLCGMYVLNEAIDKIMEQIPEDFGIRIISFKNIGKQTGYMGQYVREIANREAISILLNIGWGGGVAPCGSTEPLFGANTLSIGVPLGNELPLISDFTTAKITYGEILEHIEKGIELKEEVAIDSNGRFTKNPSEIWDKEYSLLPIANQKGSALTFSIEFLAGLLAQERQDDFMKQTGATIIIMNPDMFRSKDDFYNDGQKLINDIKNSNRSNMENEILYPGERSGKLIKKRLADDEIEISNDF